MAARICWVVRPLLSARSFTAAAILATWLTPSDTSSMLLCAISVSPLTSFTLAVTISTCSDRIFIWLRTAVRALERSIPIVSRASLKSTNSPSRWRDEFILAWKSPEAYFLHRLMASCSGTAMASTVSFTPSMMTA
ncbi:MAG: hypothetical protein BWY05_01305 [Euryarchaeota archaeon ADurb.Bin165]|nr:MAG: hypothetical protein BWY05_01305 [Euryarchaeota archaeon ADurb.Bin165]